MNRTTFYLLPLLLALTACATPITSNPNVAADELAIEKQRQELAAKQAPIDFNEKKPYGYKQVAALNGRLRPVASRIERAAESLCHEMRPSQDCHYRVILDSHTRGLNAHADGQNVVLYPAMVDFARNNNHLAFVLAHEFAHNMMQHVDGQKQNTTLGAIFGGALDVAAGAYRVNTKGNFSKFGAEQGNASYSREFEAEADYVGLYILARAGFAIEQAPDFWRMMSQTQPDAIYVSRSHPTNPARTIAMGKTVAEIRAKQRAHQPLLPNIDH